MRSQARRPGTLRIDGRYIGLALMILSAVAVLLVLAQVVPWFLSLASYIEAVGTR
jgi:hypothetical protein